MRHGWRAAAVSMVLVGLGVGAVGCGPPRYEAFTGPAPKAEDIGVGDEDAPRPIVHPRTAKEDAAAKQVIRSYVAEWNGAQSTGKTAKLASYATENCEGCRKAADQIANRVAKKGRLEGDPTQRIEFETRLAGTNPITVDADLSVGRHTYTYPSGTKAETRAQTTRYRFVMVTTDQGWRIDNYYSVSGNPAG